MRCHRIYGYGLLADCVTVATDVECHCGRRKEGEAREREGTVTQGILEEIHSICTYLSGWIPQSRMLIFTSWLTNRACNIVRCACSQSGLLFFSGHDTRNLQQSCFLHTLDVMWQLSLFQYLIVMLCLDLDSHKATFTPLNTILNLIMWKQYSYSNNMPDWGLGPCLFVICFIS